MTQYRFQVVIEQDEDGACVADVPALSRCHTQGARRKLSMGLRHEGLAFSEPPRETFPLLLGWLGG